MELQCIYNCKENIFHKSQTNILLYEKAIIIITLSKYLAHSEPLFKRLNQLTIEDLFILNQLKFCFKLINNKLPDYFKT